MAREVKLPEIAENIEEATVISILVSEGDHVDEDQGIIEIETEKAASEVPSPVAGTIKEIRVSEGDEIKIGSVIAVIEEEEEKEKEEDDDDEKEVEEEDNENEKKEIEEEEEENKKEEVEEEEDDENEKEEMEEEEEENKKEEEEEEEEEEEDEDENKKEEVEEEEDDENEKEEMEEKEKEEDEKKEKPKPSAKAEVAAAPSVRRFAREIGVDLSRVKGTGPGNRITREDVKTYSKDQLKDRKKDEMPASEISLPDFSKFGETERVPLSKVRQITAKNTLQSWNSMPHVTQFDKADVTDLEEFRQKYAKTVEKAGGKLTITAILLKIAGFALQHFPRFNSSLDLPNKEIILKKYIHIGVAVDTDRGLLVPVIRDIDKKNITRLAVELGAIASKARNKKISPGEMEGGNFVISNLGGIGGTNFTPVIFPPQVAIMGVSKSTTEPVWKNGEFKPRLMLPINITYDHRVIDGADGARFISFVKNALENPLSIFLTEKEE
ncbi:MAG: 2-oxo acid dehydrogenase subunit E2 [Bacteroidales bacterium]